MVFGEIVCIMLFTNRTSAFLYFLVIGFYLQTSEFLNQSHAEPHAKFHTKSHTESHNKRTPNCPIGSFVSGSLAVMLWRLTRDRRGPADLYVKNQQLLFSHAVGWLLGCLLRLVRLGLFGWIGVVGVVVLVVMDCIGWVGLVGVVSLVCFADFTNPGQVDGTSPSKTPGYGRRGRTNKYCKIKTKSQKLRPTISPITFRKDKAYKIYKKVCT